MHSLPYSESCPLYCQQTPFRLAQLAQRYTSPSSQINSCDYCTQTICKKKTTQTSKKPQRDKNHKEVLNSSWQANVLCLQLFPALPQTVPFTHSKLPKVLPTEQGYPANPRLPWLQVSSCSRPPPLAVQSSDFEYLRKSTYTKQHRSIMELERLFTYLSSLGSHACKKASSFLSHQYKYSRWFCRVTCLQAETLNTQFQYFTNFADKK